MNPDPITTVELIDAHRCPDCEVPVEEPAEDAL